MKKISFQYFTLVLFLATLFLSSCYEEDPWLEDNITSTGEKFPVIYMNEFESGTYSSGDVVEVVLEFFSEGELDKIVLYETIGNSEKRKVSESAYVPAFSERKALDTLALSYTVPVVADTVDIVLSAEAINTNGLTKESSQEFEAIP